MKRRLTTKKANQSKRGEQEGLTCGAPKRIKKKEEESSAVLFGQVLPSNQ